VSRRLQWYALVDSERRPTAQAVQLGDEKTIYRALMYSIHPIYQVAVVGAVGLRLALRHFPLTYWMV
jgi:hypothetical protein